MACPWLALPMPLPSGWSRNSLHSLRQVVPLRPCRASCPMWLMRQIQLFLSGCWKEQRASGWVTACVAWSISTCLGVLGGKEWDPVSVVTLIFKSKVYLK